MIAIVPLLLDKGSHRLASVLPAVIVMFTVVFSGCAQLSSLAPKKNLDPIIFEFDLNAIKNSDLSKSNHLFMGYYSFVTRDKRDIQDHLEKVQTAALKIGALKAIWIEQNTVLSKASFQTVCDFSQEKDINAVLLGEKLCDAVVQQETIEDEFRQVFSLWRQVQADNKLNQKNQQLIAALEAGNIAQAVGFIEQGAQPEVAIDEIIELHDEVLMSGILKRIGNTYGFSLAIGSGYEPVVKSFLDSGVKPSTSDVTRALSTNNLRVARLLLTHSERFPALDFLEASCWGDTRMVLRYLAVGGDPNVLINNNTPMLCAQRYGQTAVVKLFERKGFVLDDMQYPNDIWVLRFDSQVLPISLHANDFCSKVYRRFEIHHRHMSTDMVSPILYCATKDNLTSLAKSSLEQNANANFTPVYTYPLHFASYHGNMELAQALIKRGAIVDAKDIGDNTPLHNAAIAGFLDVAMLLGGAGADPTVKNSYGDTPLDAARKLKNRDVQIWLTRYKTAFKNGHVAPVTGANFRVSN